MQGEDQGRVALSEIQGRPGVYGIGALEGLAGEILVLDGQVWHAQNVSFDIVTSKNIEADLEAALLVIAEVPTWTKRKFSNAIVWDALESEIGQAVHAAGLDPMEPVPFLIEGELTDLELHVINGSCPYRHEEGAAPPFKTKVESASGTLFGFYFEGEPGILTHHGQRLHLHVLTAGKDEMVGHVDAVSLSAGCSFHLP
jgi:acetolactate decarboxylase